MYTSVMTTLNMLHQAHTGWRWLSTVTHLPGAVARLAERRLRVAVESAADEMAPRVAAERVAAEQDDVDEHDPGAEAQLHVAVGRPEGEVDVVPEEARDDQHQVEEESVQVVEEERERRLAAVLAVAQLTDRARRRIPEERAVVRLAVVVAGGAKQERRAEHPQRRADRTGLPDGRRVERREIRPALVDPAGQERGPDRVETEEAEHGDDRRRQAPTRGANRGCARWARDRCEGRTRAMRAIPW